MEKTQFKEWSELEEDPIREKEQVEYHKELYKKLEKIKEKMNPILCLAKKRF